MSHYDASRWIDYARGLTDEAENLAMRAHLEAGCRSCGAALAAQRRLLALAAVESRESPPAAAIRSIKAIFDLRRTERRTLLGALRLEPTLDSWLAPAAAGFREGDSATRMLLFESDEYALDVQIQRPAPHRREALIAGQLLARPSGAGVARVPTWVVCGDVLAAGGLTSEQGEFEIAAELREASELWLLVSEERSLTVSLA